MDEWGETVDVRPVMDNLRRLMREKEIEISVLKQKFLNLKEQLDKIEPTDDLDAQESQQQHIKSDLAKAEEELKDLRKQSGQLLQKVFLFRHLNDAPVKF